MWEDGREAPPISERRSRKTTESVRKYNTRGNSFSDTD